VLFNITGVLLILPFFEQAVNFIQTTAPDVVGQIANIHTLFNIGTTLLFIPLTGLFVKLLYHLVPEVEGQITYGPRYLNKLLLETPEAAFAALYKELQHCHEVATLMVKQIFQSVLKTTVRLCPMF
jgi:phosphate:Na+ symporter